MAIEAVIYLSSYAMNAATPGNSSEHPLGWWGYWDQSHYLRSAQALGSLDFRPAEHWYPFGYALLGAVFAPTAHAHLFLVPDLFCLLVTMAAFLSFCRALDVNDVAASALFLFGTCGSRYLRDIWVVPWNTTLSTPVLWTAFALFAWHETSVAPRHGAVRWAPFLSGMLFPLLLVTRLTDFLLVATISVGFVMPRDEDWKLRVRTGSSIAFGGLVTGLPLLLLWISIYGAAKPAYMQNSMALGFDPSTLAWRSYLLLVEPKGWFEDSAGLLGRWPWLLPGAACMLFLPFTKASAERRVLMVLSVSIFAYVAMFCMYTDLVPSGLWTFHNVHYFKWCIPGMLLLGAKLVAHWKSNRAMAVASCALVLFLTCIRVQPKPARPGEGAWMVTLRGAVSTHSAAVFNAFQFQDDAGPQSAIRDVRTIPTASGWRFIAMHRPFIGPLTVSGLGDSTWPDGVWRESTPSEGRFDRTVSLGWPCFLKLQLSDRLQPQAQTNLVK